MRRRARRLALCALSACRLLLYHRLTLGLLASRLLLPYHLTLRCLGPSSLLLDRLTLSSLRASGLLLLRRLPLLVSTSHRFPLFLLSSHLRLTRGLLLCALTTLGLPYLPLK